MQFRDDRTGLVGSCDVQSDDDPIFRGKIWFLCRYRRQVGQASLHIQWVSKRFVGILVCTFQSLLKLLFQKTLTVLLR